jgi:hypothetical protein
MRLEWLDFWGSFWVVKTQRQEKAPGSRSMLTSVFNRRQFI